MAMAGGEDKVKVLSMWSSVFAMRVLIALEEKGVQYEHQEEDLPHTKTQLLLEMNPVYKKVPVLIHNGKPVCESVIIMHYIDEAWSHKPLLPSNPYARAQTRFWADFADKKFYESVFRLKTTKGETQEEGKRDMLANLELIEGALRDMSGGEGPYFGGPEFGFMDVVFIPFASWFGTYEMIGKFKIPWDTKFPLLKVWMEKCMERESVKNILPASSKVSEFATFMRKRFVTD